jgi:hypothetical protein
VAGYFGITKIDQRAKIQPEGTTGHLH